MQAKRINKGILGMRLLVGLLLVTTPQLNETLQMHMKRCTATTSVQLRSLSGKQNRLER
jgi:hypothetical protein